MASLARRKGRTVCDSFEANEKSFGMCRACGFTLADHLGGAESDEDFDLDDVPPPPSEEHGGDESGAGGQTQRPCHNFTWKLDKNGSGLCECGFAKEDHGADDKSTSSRLSKRLSSLAQRMSQRFSLTRGKVVLSKPKGTPCEKFSLNLMGEQYGLCKCGFDRNEHDRANRVREEQKLTAKMQMEKEKAERALRGARQEACKNFDLDLTNKEGYGYCKCGFRRDQHMDFSAKAAFVGVRETLTAPKEFE